jgi:hypothetical protein
MGFHFPIPGIFISLEVSLHFTRSITCEMVVSIGWSNLQIRSITSKWRHTDTCTCAGTSTITCGFFPQLYFYLKILAICRKWWKHVVYIDFTQDFHTLLPWNIMAQSMWAAYNFKRLLPNYNKIFKNRDACIIITILIGKQSIGKHKI